MEPALPDFLPSKIKVYTDLNFFDEVHGDFVQKTHCQVVALNPVLDVLRVGFHQKYVYFFRLEKVASESMFVGEVFWSCAGRCFFEILVDTFDARDNFLLSTGQISVLSKVPEHGLRLGVL